jgi:hypothetical protein
MCHGACCTRADGDTGQGRHRGVLTIMEQQPAPTHRQESEIIRDDHADQARRGRADEAGVRR